MCSYYLVPAAARLGIAEHMRFHDLRHTYSPLMLAAGFEPFAVARYLGHSGLELLARTYGHMHPTDPNAVADKFERFASQA